MDEDNAQPEDFICDFCRNSWAEDRAMVEGHKGSLICASCLTVAFREVALPTGGGGVPLAERGTCTLCLAPTSEPVWVSPAYPEASACRKCVKQSAAILEKDQKGEPNGWKRPTA
jgi:hypothetical protein